MRTINLIIVGAVALAIVFSGIIILTRGDGGGEVAPDNESGETGTDNEPEGTGVVFKENSVVHLYVDASGNAEGKLVDQVPDSKLAYVARISVQKLGETKAEEIQSESLRKNMARYGMEVENATCEIEGVTGEGPLTFTVEMEISNYARRVENHWVISYEWVDNLAAARGVITEIKDTWVLVRNTAQSFGISNVSYRMASQSQIVLPEGAENVQYSIESQDLITRYGGGSYERSSIDLETRGTRSRVFENATTIIIAENKITVTVENVLKDSRPYRLTYQRKKPENWGFLDSIEEVRLDLKYGRGPREGYSITDSEGHEYQLSLEEILYCTAKRIISIAEDQEFSIHVPSSDGISSWGRTDWETCWEELPKEEYVSLAKRLLSEWNSGEQIEGPVGSSIGWIGIGNLLYTFTRVLDSYQEEGILPDEIKFAPSPSWGLSLNGEEISPEIAYYLLPEPDVITDTRTVRDIVHEVRKNCQKRIELPKKLLEWANEEITYTIYSFGATSEEVLESRKGKCADFSNVYLALLRSAGIPARRVTGWVTYNPEAWSPPESMGFVVGKTPDGKPIAGHAWTEVFLPENGWTLADPTFGQFENTPYEIYLPARESWIEVLGSYESKYGPL